MKKQQRTYVMKSLTKSEDSKKFIYCSLRNCIHKDCLRHNVNTPFNVLILRDTFKPDKEWNCKDKVKE